VSFCSFKFHFKRTSFEQFHASIQFCEHKAFNVQKAKFSLLYFISACAQCCFLRLGTWTQRCIKASWEWIAFDSWYLGMYILHVIYNLENRKWDTFPSRGVARSGFLSKISGYAPVSVQDKMTQSKSQTSILTIFF